MTIDLKIRVRKTEKGFVVEQKVRGLIFSKWRIISTYRGLNTTFYFDSQESALLCFWDELR